MSKGEWPRVCTKCKESKQKSDWYTTSSSPWCRKCHTADGRARRLKNLFGITPEQYDEILAYQDGKCYVCRKPPGRRRLAIDHDHKTGLVRGLLCWGCNSGLGRFRDSGILLGRAAEYLASPPATSALGKPAYGRKGRVSKKTGRRRKRVG